MTEKIIVGVTVSMSGEPKKGTCLGCGYYPDGAEPLLESTKKINESTRPVSKIKVKPSKAIL